MNVDVRALRFIDWWQRNHQRFESPYWMDGFVHWVAPLDLEDDDLINLFTDAATEFHRLDLEEPDRFLQWVRDEPLGMVITDLEAA